MKKIVLLTVGIILACIFLAHLGPMIGLIISSVIFYYAFKEFMKADKTFVKVLLGIIAVIALIATLSNVPAFVGLVALVGLYYIYKNWKKEKESPEVDDPFTNFEREWQKLQKTN
ncbi:lmo0954 family membrane protein [Aeribacillus alveayuensis]|uniref:Lia operon protein LiaI n=1 Tax=Aeribacillus alveayuensis TaxID=279215 RepID=A0ABT9VQY0_9BACI|nr:lia operon protein LiaI [Bacillus alveayuensis]